LPTHFEALLHAIQLDSSSLLVSHGIKDTKHRVCIVSTNGKKILAKFGDSCGSSANHLNNPSHLAVQFADHSNVPKYCRRVFVADELNSRVLVLDSADLTLKAVISVNQPHRLCFVCEKKILVVASKQTVKFYRYL
jgi:hypothetical protein